MAPLLGNRIHITIWQPWKPDIRPRQKYSCSRAEISYILRMVSRPRGCEYRRNLDWVTGIIDTIDTHSELQVIQRCWSKHFIVHHYTHTSVLSLHLSYPGNAFQQSSYTRTSLSLQHTWNLLFTDIIIVLLCLFSNSTANSWDYLNSDSSWPVILVIHSILRVCHNNTAYL
jgi:uncharacterized integral membrane protein